MPRKIENHEILDMIVFIENSGTGTIIKANLKSLLLELFEIRTRSLIAQECTRTPEEKLTWEHMMKRYAVLKMR